MLFTLLLLNTTHHLLAYLLSVIVLCIALLQLVEALMVPVKGVLPLRSSVLSPFSVAAALLPVSAIIVCYLLNRNKNSYFSLTRIFFPDFSALSMHYTQCNLSYTSFFSSVLLRLVCLRSGERPTLSSPHRETYATARANESVFSDFWNDGETSANYDCLTGYAIYKVSVINHSANLERE